MMPQLSALNQFCRQEREKKDGEPKQILHSQSGDRISELHNVATGTGKGQTLPIATN